jgi:hypothetical protein
VLPPRGKPTEVASLSFMKKISCKSSVVLALLAAVFLVGNGGAVWVYAQADAASSASLGAVATSLWSYAATSGTITVVPGDTSDTNYTSTSGYYDAQGKLISEGTYTMSFTVDATSGTASLTTLTNYNNSAYSVVIPSSVKDAAGNVYPVTSLTGDGVGNIFRGQNSSTNYGDSVHTITLPSTLTTIGDYVFKNCVSLTSISFPASLTTLGVGSFQNCQIASLSLTGTQVTEIPSYCFADCSTCQTVNLYDSLVQKIDDYAFYNCNMGTVSLPGTLVSIGKYGLYGGWWQWNGLTYNAPAASFASITLGAKWAKATITVTGNDSNTYSASVPTA